MALFPGSWSKLLLLALLSGSIATLSDAQMTTQASRPANRITDPIDESRLVTLQGNVHPLAAAAADQGAAPDSLQTGRMILALKISDTQQAGLNKLADDQQNSKSPNYHVWLTAEQYGARFGVAPDDLQKITDWLTGHGFTVEPLMAGHNLISFSGTNGQLRSAFHTELHIYKVNGESYYANSTDPQIPAALAGVVNGFAALNNFPRHPAHTKATLVRHNGSNWEMAQGINQPKPLFTTTYDGGTTVYHALAPYDIATIYNVLPLWAAGIDGTGQTIAIVSESDINPADVDFFRTTFGLPPKKLNIINYGPDPGLNAAEDEAVLDVQWAGAVAKNATIDLVVSAPTAASGGIDGAASYIINNNLASILNVSWGECEPYLGTAGNQYYSEIWEQAASQGITVVAAAGDSGSASCDQGNPTGFAEHGMNVSGIASTPYNVAVGGSDYHSTYVNASLYWNATNDPVTLASAKSYLPESTWNDSCASPDILAALKANGSTDTTVEALCNDPLDMSYLSVAAGSGGPSNCAVGGSLCVSGYPKPAWQSGVVGIPKDGVRDLPDVSLMAGNGIWGSFYIFCESDVLAGGVCNLNTALEAAGGTSFAAPVFSGMMALVQQKTGNQQGNVNYVLYKLAAAQYGGANETACGSAVAATGNSCMLYDIAEGTIELPCYGTSANCTPTKATDELGILPGYNTTAGYDLATGLGSLNAYNLVEGWSSATATFLPTTTTIATVSTTTAVYGGSLSVTVSVSPVAPATGLPSGDVGITSNSSTLSSISVADVTLTNGQGAVPAEQLPVGTYQLFGSYAGDATFAPSKSTGLTVTITKAVATSVLSSSRTSVLPGQNDSLSVSVTGVTYGAFPTGTMIFTNTTTGAVLGSQSLSSASTSTTPPVSVAFVTISSSLLNLGSNNITATYSGDTNYTSAAITPLTIVLSSSFTTTINPGSLTLAPNSTGSTTVTVTPNGSASLTPSQLIFSCPSTTSLGIGCSFSPAVAGPNGAITSTLTLQLASPLYTNPVHTVAQRGTPSGWMDTGFVASLAGLIFLVLPKRRRLTLTTLVIMASVCFLGSIGCTGGSPASQSQTSLVATTTALSISPTTPALGSPAVLTANVTSASGGSIPTGSILFSASGATLGTVNLTSGTAALTTTKLLIGSQAITAVYSGDSTYMPSTSVASTVDVVFTGTVAVTVTDNTGDLSSASLAVIVQ